MRYLVVSDVHANAPALAAVARDAARRGYDEALFLGDLVGYYPFAREAIAAMRALAPTIALLGNHDALMLALADGDAGALENEESVVTEVVTRQLEGLPSDDLDYLRTFTSSGAGTTWQAAHGGFRERFEYLSTLSAAQGNLPYLVAQVGLVGHTHVPKGFVWVGSPEGDLWRPVAFRGSHAHYRLPPAARAIFNPGAVGQPRDGSPLASYAIFDPRGVFEVFRVEYDVAVVQARVADAGYPASLAARLALGR
jgi:predicted phosphodiesterase